LTNATSIKLLGFLPDASGKWYQGNYELLVDLGPSSSQHEKVACHTSNRVLCTSVDIVHVFASQTWTILISKWITMFV